LKIRPFSGGIGIAKVLIGMNGVLFCSHNPILTKNLYGIVRDEGCTVDIADHPALAVRMFLQKHYDAVIFDANTFGLSTEDAVGIIKSVSPDITIIVTGHQGYAADSMSIRVPLDLEELKKLIHNVISPKNSPN
jgi:DNA-binding NtrC family response regulator